MIKRIFVLLSLLLVLTVAAVPAYAQTTTTEKVGFFSGIAHFFSGFFHKNNGSTQTTGITTEKQEVTQTEETQPGTPDQGGVQGTVQVMPMPSGKPDMTQMHKARLTMLVQQGKITQAQATAIVAKLTQVQAELKAWAKTQGIDESYVLGMGPEVTVMYRQQNSSAKGQTSGKMRPQGQGGMIQGGGQPQQ